MKRLRVLILPVSLLVLSAAASAGADATQPSSVEQRREKLRAKREQQFRSADADLSRSLTRSEIQAGGLPSALLRQFERIDTDGDGALTPEELESAQVRRVEAARTNKIQDPGS